MPKQKATFQPTVRPDWAGAMDYMSETEQSKIFQAILMFPSIDLPESAYWNKTIKPDLQNQYENFTSVCEKKAIGVRKRWENAKSIDKYTHVIDMNTNLQDKNSDEQDMLYIVKDKDKNKDKDNKGGVGEIDFDTIFQAGGQLWTLPPNFRKLALTKYTESEIRAFEMTHSCHENPENVCLNDIKHEPKPKRKIVEVTNYGQYEYLHPQMDKWLNYKKSRGERYKTEQSLMVCAKKLHELSGGNALTADAIVEQSIASNYAGLFPLKQNQISAPMSARERTDMINKQKTEALLKTMREKGMLQ